MVYRYTFLCTSLCFSASICMQNGALAFIHLNTAQMLKTLHPIVQVAIYRNGSFICEELCFYKHISCFFS